MGKSKFPTISDNFFRFMETLTAKYYEGPKALIAQSLQISHTFTSLLSDPGYSPSLTFISIPLIQHV